MKTDFKEYLKQHKAQKKIDKMAEKYAGKKVVLYGAGYFASDLLRNYDFSKLNVIGVADIKFQDDDGGKYFDYKKIGAYDLPDKNFDVVLITAFDDEAIRDFFENDLFEGEQVNFNVETLITTTLFDYIKKLFS